MKSLGWAKLRRTTVGESGAPGNFKCKLVLHVKSAEELPQECADIVFVWSRGAKSFTTKSKDVDFFSRCVVGNPAPPPPFH